MQAHKWFQPQNGDLQDGSSYMRFQQAIQLNLPKAIKTLQNLFHSLAYTLPCPICRESYKVFLKHLPISLYLSSRDDLMIWVYELHNMVNQKLIAQGAKIKIPPYPKVKKKYLSWLA